MTIEDLKNVKLSPMTAGYLAIYIKIIGFIYRGGGSYRNGLRRLGGL